MINVTTVKVDDKRFLGLRVDLPESPPLLLIVADKGFVMCGFLNIDAAEKLGVNAVMVSGVKPSRMYLTHRSRRLRRKPETRAWNLE